MYFILVGFSEVEAIEGMEKDVPARSWSRD
jgi:hypothetical protein